VDLTESERLCEEVVSLPLHPHLDDGEVEQVATAARDAALS
jgi:dTDP-4-amino-4,6-dideoxygalactose transaminase